MKNEFITLENDRTILCVPAHSFPEGIQEAFQELKRRLPQNDERTPYGISKPERDGTIVYRAGVEETTPGEGARLGCDTVILNQGTYLATTVVDWQTKIDTLAHVFDGLLQHPDLDHTSPCIEIYKNQKELVCMVRIDKINEIGQQ